MEKKSFLTKVAEVMKDMISYQNMMASIQRSCMRPEAENLELMRSKEGEVDDLIASITTVKELDIPDTTMDVLALRYLKNTQFLARIKEDDIDVSELDGKDLNFWKKTMLFKAP
jgi:hypothetical protein